MERCRIVEVGLVSCRREWEDSRWSEILENGVGWWRWRWKRSTVEGVGRWEVERESV